MTSLIPRGPYTEEELKRLYPKGLQLQLVQVVRNSPFTYMANAATCADQGSSFSGMVVAALVEAKIAIC